MITSIILYFHPPWLSNTNGERSCILLSGTSHARWLTMAAVPRSDPSRAKLRVKKRILRRFSGPFAAGEVHQLGHREFPERKIHYPNDAVASVSTRPRGIAPKEQPLIFFVLPAANNTGTNDGSGAIPPPFDIPCPTRYHNIVPKQVGRSRPDSSGRGKSELRRARCWIASRRGDPTESATENNRLRRSGGGGQGEKVV